ncbi:MAG TPA: alpha/beta hydrolase [Candidatus Saccharimonadales bacterium]|nr:alpha/beta hydrolase [Candidatus Saccharimonadales bacterium]
MINRESDGGNWAAESQTAPDEYPTYDYTIDGITQSMTATERAKWDEALAAGYPPRTERIKLLDVQKPKPIEGRSGESIVSARFHDGSKELGLDIHTKSLGPVDGYPIVFFHGTPGSAIGPHPHVNLLYLAGIRLLAISRPDCGESSSQPGRIVADCASYTEAVAAANDVDELCVAGRSGGAPGALACLALLPNVKAGAAIGSMAPPTGSSAWLANTTPGNKQAYGVTFEERATLLARCFEEVKNPRLIYDDILKNVSPSEQRVVREIREELITAFKSCGPYGRYYDVLAAQSPWGFDPADIPEDKPTFLIQSGEDPFSPIDHFYDLVDSISHSTYNVFLDRGHLGTYGYKTVQILRHLLRRVQQIKENQ